MTLHIDASENQLEPFILKLCKAYKSSLQRRLKLVGMDELQLEADLFEAKSDEALSQGLVSAGSSNFPWTAGGQAELEELFRDFDWSVIDAQQLEKQLQNELKLMQIENMDSLIQSLELGADLKSTLRDSLEQVGCMQDWIDVYNIQLSVSKLP